MKLEHLLSVLDEKQIYGKEDLEIQGVVYDPLRVKPGYLYVAINIYTQLDKIELPDGHPFIKDAIEAGAVAVMVQQDVEVPDHVTKIVVSDSRFALAMVAAEFYQHPARAFRLIGITGTNGKTTTAHIIESILLQKYRTGLIGTLYYKINGKIHQSKDTTPEPPDLQEIFTNMKNEEVDYCVMEVSSHGVDFHRVAGLSYDVGAWTNFTQDHLDWHKTMENYRAAKLRWFGSLTEDKYVVINADDPSSGYFCDVAKAQKLTYGLIKTADITARDIEFTRNGTHFTLVTPKGEIEVHSRLRGEFNLYNMLCGVGATLQEKLTMEQIKAGLESEIVVAGRFQPVDCGQDFAVIVDYAHTADGLVKVLNAARAIQPREIVTVFGCGGDRDRNKRPQMAAVVEQKSDRFIITDDNPRTEDPEQIVNDILTGLSESSSGRYEVIHDRYRAIRRAILNAKKGDLILIAGKGHESTQTLKDRTLHFNDYEVAHEILSETMKNK